MIESVYYLPGTILLTTATAGLATRIAPRGEHRTTIVPCVLLTPRGGFPLDIIHRCDESNEQEHRCSTTTTAFNEKHYLHGGIG